MDGSRQPITEMERWLLGLGAIRDQASDQIDDEIDKTAISGVFDLRNVLQNDIQEQGCSIFETASTHIFSYTQ